MSKAEIFLKRARFAKNAWLRLNAKTRRLFLYGKPRKAKMTYYVINTKYDLPLGVEPFSYIALVMNLANIGSLMVEDAARIYTYTKKDLYRAKRHFAHTSTMDILDKLVKRACERDKEINLCPLIENDIARVEELAERVREEIYYLFRYFTDEELRSLARSLTGVTNRWDNGAVKTLQLIKRIKNYNDGIAEAIEIIENYNKSFDEKHKGYMTKNGNGSLVFQWGCGYSPVNYSSVLNFIEAARKGSKELMNELQTIN